MDYNEGNRALRYIIGFGAGRATSTTLVKLYDNTNSLVGEFEVGTNMTMGGFWWKRR
ncbi:MAG: DUF4410 domain-containing protein [Campylobacter sp.]|nr:DUF4410 domain-containing protein [Campylobacter sp.]